MYLRISLNIQGEYTYNTLAVNLTTYSIMPTILIILKKLVLYRLEVHSMAASGELGETLFSVVKIKWTASLGLVHGSF